MGGFFGIASKNNAVFDLFFGIDYHSHLGARKGGMAVFGKEGFERAIHNIENSPFRTKFEKDIDSMEGCLGIGCISDNEPQPLMVRSHLGNFAISTVGRINNSDELVEEAFKKGTTHFLEMSGGEINPTELVASLINQQDSITEGIRFAQSKIKGSMSILILTPEGLYAARDLLGRIPLVIGNRHDGYCASFESFAYLNLGYQDYKELGPGEIVYLCPDSCTTLSPPQSEMKFCTFLWTYYGYPSSSYEGVNVETMRYNCGKHLAKRDNIKADIVAGVPDSGTAHAIGYANASGIPFARPFIKYTPTWPRSFIPESQRQRSLIAKMKLLPIDELIKGKDLILIDDSIVRGTQLSETAEFLYTSGAKEIHIRPACPPIIFGCKYLNFSRSGGYDDLITRRIILKREGENVPEETLLRYADPKSEEYKEMLNDICKQLNFTTLSYLRLDDMAKAVGLDPSKLCTYCWSGKESYDL